MRAGDDILISILSGATLLLSLTLGHAEALAESGHADRRPQALDVMLVLDNSGSMKKNDPKGLMRDVVSTFAARLSPGSRLGIVLFDENVRVVLDPLSSEVDDFAERVDGALQKLTYAGQRTDIPAGVERAIYALREGERSGAGRIIIFVTDGIVDVGSEARNLEQARWLREELAEEASQLGIRIFGIALTDAADFQLIQSVSRTTGGAYFRVLSAADISEVFDQIGERITELVRQGAEPSEGVAPPVVVQVPAATGVASYLPWILGGGVIAIVAVVAIVALRNSRGGAGVKIPRAMLQEIGARANEKPQLLQKPITKIGREPKLNDVVIPHETVSARHALIEFRDGSFYLRDLQSGNGTYLNGGRIGSNGSDEVTLKHRDRLRFDAYEFEFFRADIEDPRETRAAGVPASGKTQLRATPPPQPGEAPVAAPAEPAAAPAAHDDDDEAATRLKTDTCPRHPSWKATELCPSCGVAYCKSCMTEQAGKGICTECARVHLT